MLKMTGDKSAMDISCKRTLIMACIYQSQPNTLCTMVRGKLISLFTESSSDIICFASRELMQVVFWFIKLDPTLEAKICAQ